MKRLIFFLLIIPCILVAKEKQTLFFEGDLFYHAVLRQTEKTTKGLFNGDVGINFIEDRSPFYALFNFTLGFSLDSGRDEKEMGYVGQLNTEFSYFFKPIWEPVIISYNEFDILARLYWRTYSGIGLRLEVFKNERFKINLMVVPVLHYEQYQGDAHYNQEPSDQLLWSNIFGGLLSYTFLSRFSIHALWYIIPVYNFSECRIISELTFRYILFRDGYNRKSGADYLVKLRNDHSTESQSFHKTTDFILSMGIKFFL